MQTQSATKYPGSIPPKNAIKSVQFYGATTIVSLLDRKSRYVRLSKVMKRSAELVENAIVDMLKPSVYPFFTITADNGKEFTNHESIASKLGIELYFAQPYSSWERGLNENANGLVR